MQTLYELLSPLKKPLQKAYKLGAGVSFSLLRDLDIYQQYQQLNLPQMEKYSLLACQFRITETRVRQIVKRLEAKVPTD